MTERCAICWSTDNEKLVTNDYCNCKVKYCESCKDQWNKLNDRCPVCRVVSLQVKLGKYLAHALFLFVTCWIILTAINEQCSTFYSFHSVLMISYNDTICYPKFVEMRQELGPDYVCFYKKANIR